MDDADVREVIRLLQGLLKAVDNGELDGSTPNAVLYVASWKAR